MFNFVDLDHLRPALRAPSANNRMNASAAQAEYIQGAAEQIGFTLATPLDRVIFDHHDGVHGPAWKEEERPALTDATRL